MGKPIQEATDLVLSTKKRLNALLAGPEHVHNLLGINTHFDRITARLGFMGGVIEPVKDPNEKDPHPPITSFMGEKVKRNDKITNADLNPNAAAKQAYLDKVDKLYADIEKLNPSLILNSYTRQEDILVLRGVAKRAKVDGFADREINIPFIEEIILAVGVQKEEIGQQREIDEAIKPVETVLTKEMIEADKELKEWKAKPGDTLVVTSDGERTLNRAKDK